MSEVPLYSVGGLSRRGVMQKCWAMSARERPAFSRLKLLLQDALGEAPARAAQILCVVCMDRAPCMVDLNSEP